MTRTQARQASMSWSVTREILLVEATRLLGAQRQPLGLSAQLDQARDDVVDEQRARLFGLEPGRAVQPRDALVDRLLDREQRRDLHLHVVAQLLLLGRAAQAMERKPAADGEDHQDSDADGAIERRGAHGYIELLAQELGDALGDLGGPLDGRGVRAAATTCSSESRIAGASPPTDRRA